jgi:hypothetical protein
MLFPQPCIETKNAYMSSNGDVEPRGSIVERPRNEAGDAGRTRTFSFSWSLFF